MSVSSLLLAVRYVILFWLHIPFADVVCCAEIYSVNASEWSSPWSLLNIFPPLSLRSNIRRLPRKLVFHKAF